MQLPILIIKPLNEQYYTVPLRMVETCGHNPLVPFESILMDMHKTFVKEK